MANNIRVGDAPFLEQSLREVSSFLFQELLPGRNVPTVLITASSAERAIEQKLNQVTYPHAGVRVSDIRHNREGYHSYAMAGATGRGVNLGSLDHADAVYKAFLWPVVCECEAVFATRDYGDLLTLAQRWMMGRDSMNFKLVSDSATIDIHVELADEISFPEPTDLVNEGIRYEARPTFQLFTYVGEIRAFPTVKTIQLTSSSNLIRDFRTVFTLEPSSG